jgi:hypothetical protein
MAAMPSLDGALLGGQCVSQRPMLMSPRCVVRAETLSVLCDLRVFMDFRESTLP